MWIDREISEILLGSAQSRPALVLTGSRQTGKTSLLKRLFPKHHFISLDLPHEAEQAETEPSRFLERHPPPVVIDEIQYAPKIFRQLKVEIDQDRRKMGQFLMTGSQKFLLMKGVSESLAGRLSLFELEPLSWREIQKHFPEMAVETIILRGGYPELYATPELSPQEFYRSYLATYLERDVRSLLQVGSLRDYERFIRGCAHRSGQLLNKSDLAKDVGVSPTTIQQWLSVLVASNQVVLLEPWYSNQSKSMIKSPKLYLTDVGLLTFLLNIQTKEELFKSPYLGAIWETFVFSELRRAQLNTAGSWNIRFIRDRNKEVDFLIDRGGMIDLIECKWGENPVARDCEGLFHFRDLLGRARIDSMEIICRTRASHILDNQVQVHSLLQAVRSSQ